jgi:UDP-glucose 4-epimerase
MRVLVTGMGGELGSRVAMLLEGERSVDAVAGLDLEPPRRRIGRTTTFVRVDPRDRVKTMKAVREFAPTAIVHLGVYEPHARAVPGRAAEQTVAGTVAVLDAALAVGDIEALVVRSGIEVYGRRRGAPSVPDESVKVDPTSGFGRTLVRVEQLVRGSAPRVGVLRLAPVVGPHVPSPLGRYLRLPVVGCSAVADPSFSLLHAEDAARAFVHALLAGADRTYNVVASGAITASQAARLGSRVPVPVGGPAWSALTRIAELAGAPVPAHVVELLRRGRSADGGAFEREIGFHAARSTPDVVRDLYEWAPVTPLRAVA